MTQAAAFKVGDRVLVTYETNLGSPRLFLKLTEAPGIVLDYLPAVGVFQGYIPGLEFALHLYQKDLKAAP